MRLRMWILILIVVAGILGLFLPGSVQAELAGNDYFNSLHHVSFGRPNEAWRFLEIPPPTGGNPLQCRALAVFTNGDGQAIAMLAHCPVDPANSIRDAGDLAARWPSLVGEIITLVSTGETSPSVEDSTYEVTAEAVRFEMHYRSVSPGDGDFLENWVSGFLICDTANQQHIYAVRCAAPQAATKAWESDFGRIMPTLRFEGTRRPTVFVPKSRVTTWLFFGAVAAAIGVVILAFRSRKRRVGAKVSGRAILQMAAIERTASDMQNVPDQMHTPADSSYGPERTGWPAEPPVNYDRPASSPRIKTPAPYTAPDPVPAPDSAAKTDSGVAVQTEVANGFWKCACGRINPAAYDFCARCNEDRGKK